jgi:methionyl-tRNA formyltransferase
MNDVKALILCNNPIAIPGIKEFLFFGKVGAIVITKRNKEMQGILEQLMQDTGVPLIRVDKQDYKMQITTAIKEHRVNVGLMMTFPYIISPEILALPEKGFINFHYGLLPQCRGAHPILWHLLNNDPECGITVHKVNEGIDTGPVIIQEKLTIEPDDTYGLLQGKLAHLAAKQAQNLLKILSYGSMIPATAQDETQARYFEMPGAKEVTINWKEMNCGEIIRMINACNPWNKGAGTTINNWFLGITEAEEAGNTIDETVLPGTIIACNKEEGLIVLTKDRKALKINIIYTQEGFFSGHRLADFGLSPGDIFT